ncbi:MAG: hypothetical protein ACRCWQ_08690 [Bacilli bacterium]
MCGRLEGLRDKICAMESNTQSEIAEIYSYSGEYDVETAWWLDGQSEAQREILALIDKELERE